MLFQQVNKQNLEDLCKDVEDLAVETGGKHRCQPIVRAPGPPRAAAAANRAPHAGKRASAAANRAPHAGQRAPTTPDRAPHSINGLAAGVDNMPPRRPSTRVGRQLEIFACQPPHINRATTPSRYPATIFPDYSYDKAPSSDDEDVNEFTVDFEKWWFEE